MTLILVTSKRTIANCPQAMAWARGIIRGVFVALGADGIVTGDAVGGDHAALEVALELDTHIAIYRAQTGVIDRFHGECRVREPQPWCDDVTIWTPRVRPIRRNEAMARDVAPHKPTVIAILDERPTDRVTYGTERTMELCRAAGLGVYEFAWRG